MTTTTQQNNPEPETTSAASSTAERDIAGPAIASADEHPRSTETTTPDTHHAQPTSSAKADAEDSPAMVPVTESIRYRKRAQAAEAKLNQLHEDLTRTQSLLDDSRRTIEALERRQRIDALLTEADAIDLEAARLLTEAAVEQMDDAEIELVVTDLRRRKPYLFRRPAPSAAIAATLDPEAEDHADIAAQHAAATGNRHDLLQYLRMRRRA